MGAARITCPSCGKSYPVPDKFWQSGRLQVRCPQCGKRFQLSNPGRGLEHVEVPIREMNEIPEPDAQELPDLTARNDTDNSSLDSPPSKLGKVPLDPALQERRARRLARALVSELLRGRESERKKSLEDGSVILMFGEEIRRAWLEFQKQMSPEFDEAPKYFREALNEILADGKQLY